MTESRPAYWEIQPTWLFYVLAAIAVVIFGIGVFRRVAAWRGRGPFAGPRLGTAVVAWARDGLLGARLFRGEVRAAVMHLAIMWGFLGLTAGTVMVAIDHYLARFLLSGVYLVFSVTMEICGLLLLVGILWALLRRWPLRVERLTRHVEDLVVPAWLLLLALSGFALEGARLAAQQPTWASYSFAGLLLAPIWPTDAAAVIAYRVLWWGHALASLSFIAYMPYSKMLHAIIAPVSLVIDEPPTPSERSSTHLDWHHLLYADACVHCGRCEAVCPSAGASEPLSPRDCVRAARRSSATDPTLVSQSWYCTTCGACAWACPLALRPIETIAKARRAVVEEGADVPSQLAETLERLYKYQNPWIAKKGQKAAWQTDATTPTAGEAELLYFVGCTTALDTRAQNIARALTSILSRCGVSHKTLGKKEPCCGDIARRTGEVGLFEEHREKTTKHLTGVATVVTSSPHCWDTLTHAYEIEADTLHYSQLLASLLDERRLVISNELSRRVTFHDPCFLARHNGVVDEPRRVIRATGARLVEMEQHGTESLCCGGGGGRMWQDLDGQGDMAQRRIAQAAATGADAVVTACPLCLIMLEDARKTSGLEGVLEVIDLAELVARTGGVT
ncbi:heterodisulfide reductase-related iron-sulfur binding cluster [Myxococcota bacterium]